MKILIAVITMMSSFAWGFPIIPTTVAYMESSPAHTYWSASPPFTPPATPTDVCSIFGNTQKMIKVYKLRLSTLQTTAGINNWLLIKRSSANLAGTSTFMVKAASDSAELVSGASVAFWTANPTTGSSVGVLRSVQLPAPVLASNAQALYEFDFGPTTGGRSIVLRSAAEGLAVNFNGAALPPGLTVTCEFMWTEENY